MVQPVIPPPAETLEIQELEHDDTTPSCRLCGSPHVGVMTPAYVALRGSYMWNSQLGCEIFVLDDRIGIEFMVLPHGGKAIIVDINEKKGISVVAHEDCVDSAARKLNAVFDFELDDVLGGIDGIADDDNDF